MDKDTNKSLESIIERLELIPHPEGGLYREIHRSSVSLEHPVLGKRAFVTIIYYLLREGETSVWHRIRSDEIWQYLGGDPLSLECLSSDLSTMTHTRLASSEQGGIGVKVIHGGDWQAARTEGRYSLVLCTVTPGFEFQDLEFLDPDDRLLSSLPDQLHQKMLPFIRKSP
ncbi:MAG: cupin domain-containing protein [Leptospirales bacterium]